MGGDDACLLRNLLMAFGFGASSALGRIFFQQRFFMFWQGTEFYDTGIPGCYQEFFAFSSQAGKCIMFCFLL